MCCFSVLACCLKWISRAHLAVIFLWMAEVLCAISFVSPFWMLRTSRAGACLREDIGLLAECCATTTCKWVWQDNFHLEIYMPESRRVTQFVFLTGLVILLPVLLLSPFRFCCECGRTSVGISRVFTVLSFMAGCFFGSACAYFFYSIFTESGGLFQVVTLAVRWSWAFDIGVAGTCFALLSATFWYMDSKRQVVSVTSQK